MTEINHKLHNVSVSSEAENPQFILTNKKGSYMFFGCNWNISRFNGFYFPFYSRSGWDLVKTINNIKLVGKDSDKIVNRLHEIDRFSDEAKESFFMGHNKSLLYRVSAFSGEVQIVLDCRKMYDFSDKGRIYKVSKQDDSIIIEYTKFSDDSLTKKLYKIYIVIKGVWDFYQPNSWFKDYYPSDASRNSVPFELYVYDAIRINVDKRLKLVIAHSTNKAEAIREADHLYTNSKYILKAHDDYTTKISTNNFKINHDEVKTAYSCAVHSLNSLVQEMLVNGKSELGIYAGLPWFFHFWSRDETISLRGLMLSGHYDDVKKILKRLTSQILISGRLSNRYPKAGLGSADSIGWLFKRWSDFIKLLDGRKILSDYLNIKDIAFVNSRLQEAITALNKNFFDKKMNLLKNKDLETWMDTSFGGHTRSGYRMEIQALSANMFRFAASLAKLLGNKDDYEHYKILESSFVKHVKKHFYDGGLLLDGIHDYKIRPNTFLSYYIYPELLTNRQWQKHFQTILPRIWCDWGGLSTINKDSRLYHENYTGEGNESYHHGDSWFFVNNLAALCLSKINLKKFWKYIDKILEASTYEILYSGAIGHHAEVSSASQLKSEGCFSQAWSLATYIELVHDLCHR